MARILIIEDQATSRDLLMTLLGYQGHTVFEARDGAEGLALTLAEQPDLVITDILMPEMDGYEFARRVRADPGLAQTQVMFYTATYLAEEVRKLAAACGVAHMLIKPADPEQIIAAIDAALRSPPPAAPAASAPTDREYLRLLTNTLHRKVEELKAEAQAREQAERANLAKSEFLSSMSHELRTPLNAIIGFTGTLLMKLPGPLTADQEKQLKTIQTSAKHLLSLINDVLDLAKIESGMVEISLDPVTCQDVIDDVAANLRPLAEQKGLALRVAKPAEPLVVTSDRRALSQVLINLTNNAIKFTDQGEVCITLARTQLDGHVWTTISVVDTGIGIKAEDHARLFQEFGRVSSGEVRQREGSGLGLRLSEKLAQLLGGHIEFQSEYGTGSTFTLMLPNDDRS